MARLDTFPFRLKKTIFYKNLARSHWFLCSFFSLTQEQKYIPQFNLLPRANRHRDKTLRQNLLTNGRAVLWLRHKRRSTQVHELENMTDAGRSLVHLKNSHPPSHTWNIIQCIKTCTSCILEHFHYFNAVVLICNASKAVGLYSSYTLGNLDGP